MKKYILLCIIMLAGCCEQNKVSQLSTQDITEMYSSYVEDWKSEVKVAFEESEKKIFNVTPPAPKPDVVGVDPDPAKCICKGTGIIVQGDGHKTVCDYHGKTTKSK
jgi:hypothetical protein